MLVSAENVRRNGWAGAGRRKRPDFIESSGFEPANLNIPTGTTVTWTNHDGMAHTVFNTDKVFISEMLDTGEKYSFVFHKAGTYPYHCSIHSKMTGTINVK